MSTDDWPYLALDLWRWIFWINLPLGAISGVLIILFLHLRLDTSTILQKLKRVDWMGTVWFVGSATSLLIGLSWGGVLYPWSSFKTLLPLLLGIAGTILVVYWELRVAVEPFIPLRMFHKLTAKITFFTTFLHGLIVRHLVTFTKLLFLTHYLAAIPATLLPAFVLRSSQRIFCSDIRRRSLP